ncbi:hypothetical protein KFE25_013216 [Diacronema lutheri]|uniref:HNH nuclease domain-containing protein n=1 Tax=Diacronema lutheri TaxID=2081491 RepID=A0A8J5X7C7_DIALT|nr:hypothetical protein KFE25_013216 [Diacronema lutheri]
MITIAGAFLLAAAATAAASAPTAARARAAHPRACARAAAQPPPTTPTTPPGARERAEEFSRLIAAKRLDADAADIKKKDRDVDAMVLLFMRGELELFPKFQRGYTWDNARASRLIVTALCGRTIPPIFLHEKRVRVNGKDQKVFNVVDGKQRLSSLIAFRLGAEEARRAGLPAETTRAACELLRLDADEYAGWNGMRYDDLNTGDQQAFNACDIITLTIPSSYSDEQVFTIYEDINSGSDDLNAQQLRRAVFAGPYMDLVDELRENADFLRARGASEPDRNKETDGELVLRLLAFGARWREYRSPRKLFLNDELRRYEERAKLADQTPEGYLAAQRAMFARTMRVALRAFGEDAVFSKWLVEKQTWDRPLDPLVAELVFAVLHGLLDGERVSEVQLVASAPKLVDAMRALFESGEFKPGLRGKAAIAESVRLVEGAIVGAVGRPLDAKRAFALGPEKRRALWERQEGACSICGNPIFEADLADARAVHVDHVLPHARGGATDDANAALAHAACNRAGKGG